MCLDTPAICFHAFIFDQCVAWLGVYHCFFMLFA
jgi:hypothetical protein